MQFMPLADSVLENSLFRECIGKNRKYEKKRKFCKHNMTHLLNTARIMQILAFEENSDISRDIIYAAALLHDCGRWKQYEDNTPHEIAGAELADKILDECSCSPELKEIIINAIKNHREGGSDDELAKLLYRADKLSRPCFRCKWAKKCSWDDEKKNSELRY